jgi:hypothetical protein
LFRAQGAKQAILRIHNQLIDAAKRGRELLKEDNHG